jgi:hypothetical protein
VEAAAAAVCCRRSSRPLRRRPPRQRRDRRQAQGWFRNHGDRPRLLRTLRATISIPNARNRGRTGRCPSAGEGIRRGSGAEPSPGNGCGAGGRATIATRGMPGGVRDTYGCSSSAPAYMRSITYAKWAYSNEAQMACQPQFRRGVYSSPSSNWTRIPSGSRKKTVRIWP